MAVKRAGMAVPRNGCYSPRRGGRVATGRKTMSRYPRTENRVYVVKKVPKYADILNGARLECKRIPVFALRNGLKYQDENKMSGYMNLGTPARAKSGRKYKMPDASQEKQVPVKVNIKFNIDAEPLIKKKK